MARKSKIAKANREFQFSARNDSRCEMCGRPNAVGREFGVCSVGFGDLADLGLVPGVRKSSW